jgi:hypothetical protein
MNDQERAWRELEFELARIVPDPVRAKKCTIANCNGKRGWASFTVDTAEKGKSRYRINVCCGTTKTSAFDMTRQMFEENFARVLASQEQMQITLRHGEEQAHKRHIATSARLVLIQASTITGIASRIWNYFKGALPHGKGNDNADKKVQGERLQGRGSADSDAGQKMDAGRAANPGSERSS